MTLTREFFALLTYTAMIMVFTCEADLYPPPTNLSYKWLDEFTVNISWKKPSGLPEDRDFIYLLKKTEDERSEICARRTYVIESLLTEKMASDHWTYKLWTFSNCQSLNESNPAATITIHTLKPRAEVVKDFKCFTSFKELNCHWIPASQSLNLTLSYRTCGRMEEDIKSIKKCDPPYSSGERNGCYLHIDTSPDNVCILVDTEAGMSTFNPVYDTPPVVPPPELSIAEDGDYLILSWEHPQIGHNDCWIYEVCHKQCNRPMVCQNTSNGENTTKIPYDKNCLYEFRSRGMTNKYCHKMYSDFSADITYGNNELPDISLTVVAIVIPVILSISVILSCYCFRRHSSIICPVVPDPSAIFKEMMMNGNKELKTTTGSLYTPVPEPVEPCKITLVTENLCP